MLKLLSLFSDIVEAYVIKCNQISRSLSDHTLSPITLKV